MNCRSFSPRRRGRPSAVAAVAAAALLLCAALASAAPPPAGDGTAAYVSCTPTQLQTGTASTCTLTVIDEAQTGQSTPTGTITLQAAPATAAISGGGICTLAQTAPGIASCQLTITPAAGGVYQLTADYSGDTTHGHSSSDTESIQALDPTSLTVTCTPSTPAVGNPTDCTASVADPTGTSDETGTVTFSSQPDEPDDFGTPGTCTFTVSGSGSTGSCPVQFSPASATAYTISAVYAGDFGHLSSTGATTVTGVLTPTAAGVSAPAATATSPPSITPPPAGGTLAISPKGTVNTVGQVTVTLSCAGAAGTACAGALSVSGGVTASSGKAGKAKTGKGKGKGKAGKGKKHHSKKAHASGLRATVFPAEAERKGKGKGKSSGSGAGTVAPTGPSAGVGPYDLAGGQSTAVIIQISQAALQQLAAAKQRTLAYSLTATEANGSALTQTVTLTLTGKLPAPAPLPKPKPSGTSSTHHTKHKHKRKGKGK